jgi:hypothetical protein
LEETLSDALATSVSIKVNSKNTGELVIRFNGLDQLDQITSLLQSRA